MSNHEAKLAQIRGTATEKSPNIRALSTAMAHGDCSFAMLALATRTDLDVQCEGTYFEAAFGQDPQAFQRGEMFERRVKDQRFAALITLLREKAGFPQSNVRIAPLRDHAPPDRKGLIQRASETRQLLRLIARGSPDAPNIIDGAVLTCKIAGRTAYFEADSIAAAHGGQLHVAEIKAFPITDGQCDSEKLGAACDQAAWYVVLCRRTLIDAGLRPDVVSHIGFIIIPEGLGLKPTLLHQDLTLRVTRAEQLLASTPEPATILAMIDRDSHFPAANLQPDERVAALETMLDDVGTNYRPDCLRDCGMSRLCRSRAQASGHISICGSSVKRQLPGVATLQRAAELTQGAQAGRRETHAAEALFAAGAMYDRVTKQGLL